MNDPARLPSGEDRPDGAVEWVRGLRILSAVHFRDTARPRPRPTIVPGWLIEVLVEGRMAVSPDRATWRTLGPGQGFLCAPRTVHFERSPDAGRPRPYRSVYAIVADDRGRLHRWLDPARDFWWLEDAARRIEPLLNEMADRAAPAPADELAATGALLKVFSLLCSAAKREDEIDVQVVRETTPELVREVRRYLRDHLERPLRIAEIAARVGRSASALSHAYRRLTGVTVMQELRGLRVEAARHHLIRNRMKLEAIAEATGFADAAHLSRTFKRAIGQGPRRYRQCMLDS